MSLPGSFHPHLPIPRPVTLWVRFLLGLGAIVGAKLAVDRWYDMRWAAWNRYVSRGMDDQSRLRISLFGAMFDDGVLGSLGTWEEISSRFGLCREECHAAGGGAVTCVLPGRRINARTSPGWVVTLVFRAGKLERVGLKPPPPPPTPPAVFVRAWSMWVGPTIALVGAIVWAGAFVGALTEPRRPDAFGQVALAGAVTALAGCALWGGADDQLGLAGTMGFVYVSAAMAFASFGVREGLFRRADPDEMEARCRKCGYDLCGNVSGACPECGTVTRRHLRRMRSERLDALAYKVALAAQVETLTHED